MQRIYTREKVEITGKKVKQKYCYIAAGWMCKDCKQVLTRKKFYCSLYHFPDIGMSPVIPKLYDRSTAAPFHAPFPL